MRWTLALSVLAFAATPAAAALPQGAKAPQIATTGAVGGKAFKLDLQKQLKKDVVVLYFFPKAFTKGCTLEAHSRPPSWCRMFPTVVLLISFSSPLSRSSCRTVLL